MGVPYGWIALLNIGYEISGRAFRISSLNALKMLALPSLPKLKMVESFTPVTWTSGPEWVSPTPSRT